MDVVVAMDVMFQLTRPCGSRRVAWRDGKLAALVSTHATLRVATWAGFMSFGMVLGFNSRDPAGRDRRFSLQIARLGCFNSRDPAGRDVPIGRSSPKPTSFNSRDPAGRDF